MKKAVLLNLTDPALYIRSLVPPRTPLLAEMEQKAQAGFVSIVEPEVAQLIYFLAVNNQCQNVLEIGTGIGYSALWLAEAVAPHGGVVTSIELKPERYAEALKYIQRAGQEKTVQLILGDARELLPTLQPGFDLIFLDAAKAQYLQFLGVCVDLLRPGGLLIAEDIFYHGMVISGEADCRRNQTITKRLRDFINALMQHETLTTALIPLGDGIAVSTKRKPGL